MVLHCLTVYILLTYTRSSQWILLSQLVRSIISGVKTQGEPWPQVISLPFFNSGQCDRIFIFRFLQYSKLQKTLNVGSLHQLPLPNHLSLSHGCWLLLNRRKPPCIPCTYSQERERNHSAEWILLKKMDSGMELLKGIAIFYKQERRCPLGR